MKITKVLGTEGLYQYLEKYDIPLDAQYDDLLGKLVLFLYWSFVCQGHDTQPKAATLNGRGRDSSRPRTNDTSRTRLLIS